MWVDVLRSTEPYSGFYASLEAKVGIECHGIEMPVTKSSEVEDKTRSQAWRYLPPHSALGSSRSGYLAYGPPHAYCPTSSRLCPRLFRTIWDLATPHPIICEGGGRRRQWLHRRQLAFYPTIPLNIDWDRLGRRRDSIWYLSMSPFAARLLTAPTPLADSRKTQ